MEEAELNFFFEDIDEFSLDSTTYFNWVSSIVSDYNKELSALNYIFCSDSYLLEINKQYLDHDYFTDIITFDNSEEEVIIEGDIFISVNRVKENADSNNTSFTNELNRVISHGLLHLIGFGDKTDEEKVEMRKREDACLSLLPN